MTISHVSRWTLVIVFLLMQLLIWAVPMSSFGEALHHELCKDGSTYLDKEGAGVKLKK